MNRSLSFLRGAACAAACALTGSAASAASPAGMQMPFAGDALAPAALPIVAVDDDVLARQSGKFADATMVSGFVVNLLSQWQLPNGALAVAQGSLNVVANAANQLSAQVQTAAAVVAGDPSRANGTDPNASASGGQTIRVNGVSQVTQVAGNGNTGSNAMTIDFGPNLGPASAMLPGASSAPSASAASADGTIRASIGFGANGVRLVLNTPAGVASQIVAPAAAQAGSIAQLLQVAGNQQFVSNQLQLQLRTQQMSGGALRQAGILQALQAGFGARR